MGLFDDIKWEAKETLNARHRCHDWWQTKSFEYPYMEKYRVSPGGFIYKNGEKIEFHGDMKFCSIFEIEGVRTFVEYKARFTEGLLRTVKLLDEHKLQPL